MIKLFSVKVRARRAPPTGPYSQTTTLQKTKKSQAPHSWALKSANQEKVVVCANDWSGVATRRGDTPGRLPPRRDVSA
jgi:hypothetical protein